MFHFCKLGFWNLILKIPLPPKKLDAGYPESNENSFWKQVVERLCEDNVKHLCNELAGWLECHVLPTYKTAWPTNMFMDWLYPKHSLHQSAHQFCFIQMFYNKHFFYSNTFYITSFFTPPSTLNFYRRSCYVALCRVMLCSVVLCCGMSCNLMSCYIMYAMLCHVMSGYCMLCQHLCHVMSRYVMLRRIMALYAMLCRVLSRYVTVCNVMSCHCMSC